MNCLSYMYLVLFQHLSSVGVHDLSQFTPLHRQVAMGNDTLDTKIEYLIIDPGYNNNITHSLYWIPH